MILIKKHTKPLVGEVRLPYSKSIFNRIAILDLLYTLDIELIKENLSRDSELLLKVIQDFKNGKNEIDVDDAGTVARFMLGCSAALSSKSFTITGSKRMCERPMEQLINWLNNWGGQIININEYGRLPVRVEPGQFNPQSRVLEDMKSSQFASIMLMLAPKAKQPINISIPISSISMPYIDMTTEVMKKLGFEIDKSESEDHFHFALMPFNQNSRLSVKPELDWSAFHYWWCLCALLPNSILSFPGLTLPSLQGDAKMPLKKQNVEIKSLTQEVKIESIGESKKTPTSIDFINQPDLAPTYIVYCAILKTERMEFRGLQTLQHKESDRTSMLQKNLNQFHVHFYPEGDSWILEAKSFKVPKEPAFITTGKDHRMAMSFALLATQTNLIIDDEDCIRKSYPLFWEHLQNLNFDITTRT